ncbi:MAG: hypothetical protein ACI4QC_05250, partial [Thermoguttaceae bacterium]
MKQLLSVKASFTASVLAAFFACFTASLQADEEQAGGTSPSPTKLLRYPDVFENQVVFCYAGDIWKSDFDGTKVSRLTAHEGLEEFPKFSPAGKMI